MNRLSLLQSLGGGSGMAPVLVVKNQDVRDIINLIKYKHKKCVEDYDKIAAPFWAGNVYDTCAGLWDFCKKNIRYEVETEKIQTVSQPAVILSKGVGDCKHYSLFIAGILDALRRQGKPIDWYYRFASYDLIDDTPGHVFVVVKENNGNEIWIDPVLSHFDDHKTFYSAIDKKVDTGGATLGAIHYKPRPGAALGLSAIKGQNVLLRNRSIGTTQQTGELIAKISPTLAVVPVVGWVAAAAGEVVGLALTLFGNKWSQSTYQRWLTQLYQYFVLGQCNVGTDNKINEAYTPQAVNWFSIVLGVPCIDRSRFNTLKGVSYQGGQSLNQTYAQRGATFLKYPDIIQAGITLEQATQAAILADTLDYKAPCGGWKNATAAPSLVQTSTEVQAAANLTSLPTAPVTSTTATNFLSTIQQKLAAINPVFLLGGAALLIILLTDKKN